MSLGLSLGLGLGPRGSRAAAIPGLIVDFVNNIYSLNGTLYGTFPLLLAAGAGSGTFSAGYDMAATTSFSSNAPRITSAGLLIEPAATNLLQQSKMASGWTNENGTVTANSDAAPDGTTTAARVKEDASVTTMHGVFQQRATPALAAVRYVKSSFAKRAVGIRDLQPEIFNSSFGSLALGGVNLSTGAVSVTSFATGAGWTAGVTSALAAGNSYWRCANSFVPAADASGFWTFDRMMTGTNPQYSGDNTSAISVWGQQLEVAAAAGYYKDNPSSLIVTAGASATRAADALSLNVPAGKTSATITFSDASTKVQAVTGGSPWDVAATVAAHVAANVVQPTIRSITFA